MDRQSISRINQLTALSRQRPLTEEEHAERHRLRQAYREAFRGRFRAQLDNTVVEYPDGSRESLREAGKRNGGKDK